MMIKLCFGTFMTILAECSASASKKNILCGKLLLCVNDQYDICGESTTISKLMNGYSNLSPLVKDKIHDIDPRLLVHRIKDDFLPYLDSNKYKYIVSAIFDILKNDESINDGTVVDRIGHYSKEQLQSCDEFVIEELIAGILIYVIAYTDNKYPADMFKKITNEYLEKTYADHNAFTFIDVHNNNSITVENTTTISRHVTNRKIVVGVLVGQWSEKYDGDLQIIKEIFAIEPDELADCIKEDLENSGFIYKKNIFICNNHKEMIKNIAPVIYDEDIDCIFRAAKTVLEEINPKYDLPSEQRYLSCYLTDNNVKYSENIKKGITDTIAIICNEEDVFTNCSHNKIINSIYLFERELLMNKGWKFYATIADYFNALAEACPDVFVERILKLLENSDIGFIEFLKEKETAFTVQRYGYQLAVALRHIAVSEAMFSRAMLVLIKLADYQDLFLDTLVGIVLPWYPQTHADMAIRTGVFKGLARENENATWKALMKLMPRATSTSTCYSHPQYMEIQPLPDSVLQRDYISASREYVLLACSMVNGYRERIADLFTVLDDVSIDLQDMILKEISTNVVGLNVHEKELLWNIKEDFLLRHRKFSDAKWALSDKQLLHIDNALSELWTDTNAYKIVRMFRKDQFKLLEDNGNFRDEEERLETEQLEIINKIYSSGGIDEVVEFAGKVENKNLLGRITSKIASTKDIINTIKKDLLKTNTEFVNGILAGLEADTLIKIAESFDDETCATVLAFGVVQNKVLCYINRRPKLQNIYYKNVQIYGIACLEKEEFLSLITGLRNAGRINEWIFVLYVLAFNSKIVIDIDYILDELLSIDSSEKIQQHEVYEIQRLISRIQGEECHHEKMMELEWKYLEFLDENDGCQPVALWQEMARNPEMFIDVIKTFCGKNKLVMEESQKAISQYYRLISGWNIIPGNIEKSTLVDKELLLNWFNKVKELAMMEDVYAITMNYCGKLFFHSPKAEDGFFINRDIAELIESETDDAIRSGYEVEAINSRGVHIVDPTGQEEFRIEQQYIEQAKMSEREGFIRLGDSLRSIARSFRNEGEMHIREYKDMPESKFDE